MTKSSDPVVLPLLERISFLVHRINAHLLREMNPRLRAWGVDLTESRLLVALLGIGPLTAGELVRVMALPQSTVSHQIKRLEKRGYVTRTADVKDSRVIIAQLTDQGREIARQAEDCSRDVTRRFSEAIHDEKELAVVRSAMKKIDQAFVRDQ